jgi:putative oxidoreductase
LTIKHLEAADVDGPVSNAARHWGNLLACIGCLPFSNSIMCRPVSAAPSPKEHFFLRRRIYPLEYSGSAVSFAIVAGGAFNKVGSMTIIRLLNRIPYALIGLIARAATFSVFFRSGTQKLSDWNATLQLFQNEYRVPLLPPHLAAYLAASVELSCSVLVLVGLATRLGALTLLGLVAVIQLFVYPSAWPDHIQWLAFMLILLARGPGPISIDSIIAKHMPSQPIAAAE